MKQDHSQLVAPQTMGLSQAEFAKRISAALDADLERNKITQEELATSIGVSQAAVSSWRVGISKPKGARIEELRKKLGADSALVAVLTGKKTVQESAAELGGVSPVVQENYAQTVRELTRVVRELAEVQQHVLKVLDALDTSK